MSPQRRHQDALLVPFWGRCCKLMRLMCARAGLPRDDVIFSQAFYDDILACAPELELTIMAIPSRPLPLKDTRDALLQRLSLGLRQVWPPRRDMLQDPKSFA